MSLSAVIPTLGYLESAISAVSLVKGIDETVPYPYENRPGYVPSTNLLRNWCTNRNTQSHVEENNHKWQFSETGNSTRALAIQINKNNDGHVVFTEGRGAFAGTYTLANVEEVEAGLANKADISSVYTKTQIDELIGSINTALEEI